MGSYTQPRVGESTNQLLAKIAESIDGQAGLTDEQLRASPVPVAMQALPDAPLSVVIQSGPNLDAFSRLRTSIPQGLFDGQFTYNLLTLLYEQITAQSGATVAHDATNRCALMTFANTPTGGAAYMQSYEYIRYQPGRSQAAFITFNMVEGVASVLKFAGISDGNNGIEFRLNGTTKELAILSDTSLGDEIVAQANWNLDKLNGTGSSGLTLDVSKCQILVIDLQALYVGRVRVGFDIDGAVVYAHEFNHANLKASPYIQYASLPVRCGMTCTGTVSTTMQFICASVISEGGQEENGGVPLTTEGSITAGSGTDTHILSVRPKTTFNSITNRIKFVLDSIDIAVTGNNPVLWKLVVGQSLTNPTFTDVNTTYSAAEALAGAGTLSGTPAIVLMSGYVAASASQKGQTSPKIFSRIPITLTAAGAARVLGTVTVLVQGIGGTSATRVSMNWRELR